MSADDAPLSQMPAIEAIATAQLLTKEAHQAHRRKGSCADRPIEDMARDHKACRRRPPHPAVNSAVSSLGVLSIG